jgi:hypothetical protein
MEYDFNNYAVDVHFPTLVYRNNRADFLHVLKPLFDEYVDKSEKINSRDKIYPVIMTGDMANDERIINFSNYVAQIAWEVLNAQGYFMDSFLTTIRSIWGQNHGKYSSMDYHFHGDGKLCGFYFIDTPENSSNLIIHDPKQTKIITGLPVRSSEKLTPAHDFVYYNPKPGDLFLTNGWLPHSFTRNGSDLPFNFLHINFDVINNPDYNPQVVEQPIIV